MPTPSDSPPPPPQSLPGTIRLVRFTAQAGQSPGLALKEVQPGALEVCQGSETWSCGKSLRRRCLELSGRLQEVEPGAFDLGGLKRDDPEAWSFRGGPRGGAYCNRICTYGSATEAPTRNCFIGNVA